MMTLREEKEKMMDNELRIIKDMKELMQHSPEEGLVWKSTRQDLFYMIHILYESGEVHDEYNISMTYAEMVRRFCNILHVAVPRNPRAYVQQSMCCRGVRIPPLLLRYTKMYV